MFKLLIVDDNPNNLFALKALIQRHLRVDVVEATSGMQAIEIAVNGLERIDLISGFRKKPDSETSRHFHGSAMDIRVPGISTRKLYEFASSLDTGGMGVGRYPASDFVHVDFRAPGEKSYRWTDYSPPKSGKKKRRKPQKSRRGSRPNV